MNRLQLQDRHGTSNGMDQRIGTATILIVEDEESLAEILDFNLRRQGFATLIASDGLEACRIVGREKPDLILLDIMLPLLSGWEICRMIRNYEDQTVRSTPIIMLSALATEEDQLKGYKLGIDLYLPKPFNIKEIVHHSRLLTGSSRLASVGTS